MDFGPLIYMVLGAAGSLVMWLILGPAMTGLGVKRMARRAAKGNKKALEFFNDLGEILLKWAGSAEIRTGEKVKVPTGKTEIVMVKGKEIERPIMKEVDEILTPIEMLARVIGNYSVMHLKGWMGGKTTQMNEQISQAMAQSGGDPEAMLPIALAAAARGDYGPAIMVGLQILKSKQINAQSGGLVQQNKGTW